MRVCVSERRACRLLGFARPSYHYRGRRDPRTALRSRMREIAAARVRYGDRKIRVLLQREGFEVSKKLVYRVYREEGLSLRYRASRTRRSQATRPQRPIATMANQAWSLDFVCDQLCSGERFRALTIVNVFTREALAIKVGSNYVRCTWWPCSTNFAASAAHRKLWLCDNGSEFTSQVVDLWAYQHGVRIDYSRPGKPTDNAFIESLQWYVSR